MKKMYCNRCDVELKFGPEGENTAAFGGSASIKSFNSNSPYFQGGAFDYCSKCFESVLKALEKVGHKEKLKDGEG